jgi:DNA-binding HxlR family transcriptional regulator
MADRWGTSYPVVSVLAGRWTLKLVGELFDDGLRYQELHDALDGISHKVLTDTLRRAERDGLVNRLLDPSRIETATLYRLTDLGRSLDEPLAAVSRWAEVNWSSVETARQGWSHRNP